MERNRFTFYNNSPKPAARMEKIAYDIIQRNWEVKNAVHRFRWDFEGRCWWTESKQSADEMNRRMKEEG